MPRMTAKLVWIIDTGPMPNHERIVLKMPSSCKIFTRRSMTHFSSFIFGMPYIRRPPTRSALSYTVTLCPRILRRSAAASPEGPEPITATLCPFYCAAGTGLIPFSFAQSATKRSSLPMETASPFRPRIHLPSHCVS